MSTLMIQSKIQAESAADVEAAVKKMLVALDAAQPEGIRYASSLLPDGQTFIALLDLEDGVDNPLTGLPEYQELLELVEGARAEPPIVQSWTVIGSYRLL
jgi:hypothetical protein